MSAPANGTLAAPISDSAIMVLSFSYRSYAVTREAGGLEGRRSSEISAFWPAAATAVAATGQKGMVRGRQSRPRTPTAQVLFKEPGDRLLECTAAAGPQVPLCPSVPA